MVQGWYLAADTQIFLVSLIIMIMGSKFAKFKNWIYGGVVLAGVLITGTVVYVRKFDGIFVPSVQ